MKNIKDFINRINGVSTPIIGVSWEVRDKERSIIYSLIQKLGDRRLLKADHGIINLEAAKSSNLIMRREITETIVQISSESTARKVLENMRTVLHEYQNFLELPEYKVDDYNIKLSSDVIEATTKMRKFIGGSIKLLSEKFNFTLSDGLYQNFDIDL